MMLNVPSMNSYRVFRWLLYEAELPQTFFTIGFIAYQTMLSTPWCSRAVPQPSTDLALHRFAVEFRWDPAFSMQYGRRLQYDQ